MSDLEEVKQLIEEARRERFANRELQERIRDLTEERRRTHEIETQRRVEQVPQTPGRVGLVSPERRQETRRHVEGKDFGDRFLSEMAPATVGTGVGALAGGALGGPLGAVGGGVVGGALGELFGQETGITPESDVGLAVAAGAPAAAPFAGAAARGVTRMGSRVISGSPPVRQAQGELAKRGAAKEFEHIGARILSERTGPMAGVDADTLFSAARNFGAQIPSRELTGTARAIKDLRTELLRHKDVPNVKTSLRILDRVENDLLRGGAVSFDNLIWAREQIGTALNQAAQGGVRSTQLRSAGKVYSSMMTDLDAIQKAGLQSGRGAEFVQAAFQRVKLDKSLKELDQAVAQYIRPVPGKEDAFTLNIPSFRKWLTDVTNPKHRRYNKNFSDALKDELPAIKSRLAALDDVVEKASFRGGQLVVQGTAAAAGAGMMAGGLSIAGIPLTGIAGAAAVGAGGLAGTQIPRAITTGLLTERGARMLNRLAVAGRGEIDQARWTFYMQAIAQSAEKGGGRGVRELLEEE